MLIIGRERDRALRTWIDPLARLLKVATTNVNSNELYRLINDINTTEIKIDVPEEDAIDQPHPLRPPNTSSQAPLADS